MVKRRRIEQATPAGSPLSPRRWTAGQLRPDRLSWILDGPCACRIFLDDVEHNAVLTRDPARGLALNLAGSLPASGAAPATSSTISVIDGMTEHGVKFSIHDAQLEIGMTQTQIYGRLNFIGTADLDRSGPWTKPQSTFDNFSVWIDWLPEFLAGPTANLILEEGKQSSLNLPPAVSVGAVDVEPATGTSSSQFDIGLHGVRLDLRSRRRQSIEWWIDEWVNPLQQLIVVSLGVPAKVTLLATKTNERKHEDHFHHDWLFVSGRGWPTMDLEMLKPQSPLYQRVPAPLLHWQDPQFDLGRSISAVRRIGRQLEFVAESYNATIYDGLSPRHGFLNLVQAAESLHIQTAGLTKGGQEVDVEALVGRLKAKNVSSKDRKRIRAALDRYHPRTFRLDERLGALRVQGLPAPPDDAVDWLPSDEVAKLTTWEATVARARNDISHGSATPSNRWLRRQNTYLKMLIERELLARLQLPGRYCTEAASYRYRSP